MIIDVLIIGGSLILLQADARSWLGWLAVVPGVACTFFANIESQAGHGTVSAVIAAVPAAALSIAVLMLERWFKLTAPDTPPDTPDTPSDTPADTDTPVSEGVSVPSLRHLMDTHKVGAPKARQIQQEIRAGYNGHGGN